MISTTSGTGLEVPLLLLLPSTAANSASAWQAQPMLLVLLCKGKGGVGGRSMWLSMLLMADDLALCGCPWVVEVVQGWVCTVLLSARAYGAGVLAGSAIGWRRKLWGNRLGRGRGNDRAVGC